MEIVKYIYKKMKLKKNVSIKCVLYIFHLMRNNVNKMKMHFIFISKITVMK